jgi:serine/threonine protein kinase
VETQCKPVDLDAMVKFVKVFSGGKSGAYIILVEKDGHKCILKVYPDTYGEHGKILNERPFREISTLCALSGVDGFPCMISRGCASIPSAWRLPIKGVCPFVIMSLAEGEELTKIDLRKFSPQQAVGIVLQIIKILENAQQRLGSDFEHFDLHPDNIFIQSQKCTKPEHIVSRFGTLTVSCPAVSIIDFDLVNSQKLFGHRSEFMKVLHEQTEKKLGKAQVPERTIAFIAKWLGIKASVDLVSHLNNLGISSTDIRNWLVISQVILKIAGVAEDLHDCKTLKECVNFNYELFSSYIRGLSSKAGARTSVHVTTNLADDADRVVTLLIGSTTEAKSLWSHFEQCVLENTGRYPNQDSIRLRVGFNMSERYDVSVGGTFVAGMKAAKITASFKGGVPSADITFDQFQLGWESPGLQNTVKALRIVQSLITKATSSLTGSTSGVHIPFHRGHMTNPVISVARIAVSKTSTLNIKIYFALNGVYSYLGSALRTFWSGITFDEKDKLWVITHDIVPKPSAHESAPNPCKDFILGTGEKSPCMDFIRNAAKSLTFLVAEESIGSALKDAKPKPFAYLSDTNAECFSRSLLSIVDKDAGFLSEVFKSL